MSLPTVRVALFNVRSIFNMRRRRALMTALTACDYDVFALTETWLTGDILDSELQITGFNIHRCDRPSDSA